MANPELSPFGDPPTTEGLSPFGDAPTPVGAVSDHPDFGASVVGGLGAAAVAGPLNHFTNSTLTGLVNKIIPPVKIDHPVRTAPTFNTPAQVSEQVLNRHVPTQNVSDAVKNWGNQVERTNVGGEAYRDVTANQKAALEAKKLYPNMTTIEMGTVSKPIIVPDKVASEIMRDRLAAEARGAADATRASLGRGERLAFADKLRAELNIAPNPTTMQTARRYVENVGDALNKVHGSSDFLGRIANKALTGAAAFGAGVEGTEAVQHARLGHYGRAAVSGLGAIGGAMSMTTNPVAKPIGLGMAIAAPFANSALDNLAKTHPDWHLAAGGSVSVEGAPPEYDSAPPVKEELTIPQILSQMYNSPANKLPTMEDAKSVAQGFGSAGESLGRGAVAGVPGMFGDVNSLAREYVVPHLPQSVQSALQSLPAASTTEDYLKQIPRYSKEFGDENANNFMTGLGSAMSPNALAAAKPAAGMIGSAMGDRIMAGKSLIPGTNTQFLNPQILSAVKQKGGNWTEFGWPIEHLKPVRFREYTSEQIADHMKDYESRYPDVSPVSLRKADAARATWIESKLKKYIRNDMGTPTDPVRELADQGISHISDLGNRNQFSKKIFGTSEKRKNANLPEEGFAKTAAGRDWENATDASIENRTASDVVRFQYGSGMDELAKNNPDAVVSAVHRVGNLEFRHLLDELGNSISPTSDLPKHLQIKPETLDKMTVPHAVSHVAKVNKWRADNLLTAAKEDLKSFPVVHMGDNGLNIHELKLTDSNSIEQLDKALKNEGKQMGHCVGGYSNAVASGKSRIFSLRDAEGGAHTTIEANPAANGLQDIIQIKGKGNGVVGEKYRKNIQDFLNTQPIDQANDLHNVGLIDSRKVLNKGTYQGKRFLTQSELDAAGQ